MTTQPTDVAGLVEIAKAATPGPWKLTPMAFSSRSFILPESAGSDTMAVAEAPERHDARFIATFNPAKVLELLAALQAAEAALTGERRRIEECYQIAGKALGYPWFKDDQKNFPGSTEEHGVCAGEHVAETLVEELAARFKAAEARATAAVGERDEARKWADELWLERNVRADAAEASLSLAVKGLEEIERHWLASAHPLVGYVARTTLSAIRSGDSSPPPAPMPIAQWGPIATAPEDNTRIIVRTARGAVFVAYMGEPVDGDDGPCWTWAAEEERLHPPCWTDGLCWASNEDEEPSDPPTHWMPLPPPPAIGPGEAEAKPTANEPKECSPADNFGNCPFKRTGRLSACHEPGGCLNTPSTGTGETGSETAEGVERPTLCPLHIFPEDGPCDCFPSLPEGGEVNG